MKVERLAEGRYRVQSFTDQEVFYEVTLEPEVQNLVHGVKACKEESCSCPHFQKRLNGNGGRCKHIRAVLVQEGRMTKEEAKKADEWKSKGGYPMDEVTSALQKAIRRGDEELAGFWAMEAVDSGYGSYLLHRLSVIACEDIGLADPMASVIVGVTKLTIEMRMEEQRKRGRWASFPPEVIGFLILYLCRSPKSRQADDFVWLIQRRRKAGWKAEVPGYALDEHTKRGKARIKRIAAERGVAQAKVAEEIFYTEAGLLKNAVDVDGRNWTRELFKDMELPYTGYRLEE